MAILFFAASWEAGQELLGPFGGWLSEFSRKKYKELNFQ